MFRILKLPLMVLILTTQIFSVILNANPIAKCTMTFDEVMQKLVDGYPSIEAFEHRTAAAKDRAKSSWWSYGPNFVASAGQTIYSGQITSLPNTNKGNLTSVFYGLSFTLFDGGAIAFASKALDTQAEAAELNARLNVENLAIQASQAYAGLIISESYMKFLEVLTTKLKEYSASPKIAQHYGPEFADQLENTTSLYVSKLVPARQNMKTQENLLKLVAVGATDKQLDELEPLENLITKIEIPKDVETAVQMIPETIGYQIATRNVEAAKFNKYASYAKNSSPVVTANLGQTYENNKIKNYPEEKTDASMLAIKVSYSLGVTNYYSGRAAAQDFEAAKADRETFYRDSEFTIRNAYLKLAALEENFRETHHNLDKGILHLNEISRRLEKNQSVDLRSALESLNLTNEMWLAYSNALTELFLARTQMAASYGFYSTKYLPTDN